MGAGLSTADASRPPELQKEIAKQYLMHAKAAFTESYHKKIAKPFDPSRLEQIRTVGTGSFGRVLLVRDKQQKDKYLALKVLEKARVVKMKQVEHTLNEKRILAAIDFPFFVSMEGHLQDNCNLYMLFEFVPGGELFSHLRNCGRYPETHAKFYAAQVVLAFEYLHSLGILYRDLKPENLLFSERGYLKITDFGFAKYIGADRTYTLCGTPEYIAPEVILMKGYGKPVDWWALGVFIYEMVAGYPPFVAQVPMKIYEKIVVGKYKTPNHFSREVQSLLSELLNIDTTRRIGSLHTGADAVKDHAWFHGLDWVSLFQQEIPAPYKPSLSGPGDHHNYERYDEEGIKTSPTLLFGREFAEF